MRSRGLALALIVGAFAAVPSARAAEPMPMESHKIEAPKIESQQIAIDSVSFSIEMIRESLSMSAPLALDSISAIAQAPPLAVAVLDAFAPSIVSIERQSRFMRNLLSPARSSVHRSPNERTANFRAIARHRPSLR